MPAYKNRWLVGWFLTLIVIVVQPSSARTIKSQGGTSITVLKAGAIPSWRVGMVAWQWKEIPNSALSLVGPSPIPAPGSLDGRLNAWSGLAVDDANSRLYLSAGGGHGDYAGNETYEIDLKMNAPKWSLLDLPSLGSDVVADSPYYADKKPTSTHTAYTLQFIKSLRRVMRFGANLVWGSGNANFPTMDGFNVDTRKWDRPATWPDVAPVFNYSQSICKNLQTEEVYFTPATGAFRRFSPVAKTWTNLAQMPNGSGSTFYYVPCAVDVDKSRNRILFFGNAYKPNIASGYVYDIAKDTFTDVVFSGANASTVSGKTSGMAFYDQNNGYFVFKSSTGANLYKVDPTTYAVSEIVTTGGAEVPNALNGVWTKFVFVAALKGYAYVPHGSSNVWFLANQ